RVLTLTTLGTPHRGTVFADWSLKRLGRIVRPVLGFLGLPHQAFYDLTTENCKRFNLEVPDAARVRYFSVAARHDGSFMNPEWLLPYSIVYLAEGDNDGVVSIASASYGEHTEVWEGDHFTLVNWLNPMNTLRNRWHNPAPKYGPLLARLRDE